MVFFIVIVCRVDFSHVRPSLVKRIYNYFPCLKQKSISQLLTILMIMNHHVNSSAHIVVICSSLSYNRLREEMTY